MNADKGFNNFLACIEGLEYFNDPSKKASNIKVDVIKTYMTGLMYICSQEFRNELQSLYNGLYTGWFDSFINCLWNEINTYDGNGTLVIQEVVTRKQGMTTRISLSPETSLCSFGHG